MSGSPTEVSVYFHRKDKFKMSALLLASVVLLASYFLAGSAVYPRDYNFYKETLVRSFSATAICCPGIYVALSNCNVSCNTLQAAATKCSTLFQEFDNDVRSTEAVNCIILGLPPFCSIEGILRPANVALEKQSQPFCDSFSNSPGSQ